MVCKFVSNLRGPSQPHIPQISIGLFFLNFSHFLFILALRVGESPIPKGHDYTTTNLIGFLQAPFLIDTAVYNSS